MLLQEAKKEDAKKEVEKPKEAAAAEEKKEEKPKDDGAAAAEDKPKEAGGGGGEEKPKDGEEKRADAPPPPPPPPEEVEMRVYMHCEGCARKVKKILKRFDGNACPALPKLSFVLFFSELDFSVFFSFIVVASIVCSLVFFFTEHRMM